MIFNRESFLIFCSEITGYSTFELEGTGLVDSYHQLIQEVLGRQLTEELSKIVANILFYPAGSEERENVIRRSLLAPAPFWFRR
jgi:hypothetical protein